MSNNLLTIALPSADAVGAVAAMASVLLGGWTTWVAWRAAVPYRELNYSTEMTPLLSSMHRELTVSLGGDVLDNPHAAKVRIENIGNREIEAAAFNGEPIELNMNAHIVAVLDSHTNRNWRVPPFDVRGDTLYIEPYVIHKGQVATFKLLLDGSRPEMTLRHSLSARVGKGLVNWKAIAVTFVITSILLSMAFPWFIMPYLEKNQREQVRRQTEWVRRIQEDAYRKGMSDGKRNGESATDPSSVAAPTCLGSCNHK
ncbi:hypothetical protein [Streptomyces sp. NPDC060187]|uniref:hypothetical protein n=1 Tax=Streptomyces sp. NPDC060187 TaxID=3347067 RepID=UPI00365F2F0D